MSEIERNQEGEDFNVPYAYDPESIRETDVPSSVDDLPDHRLSLKRKGEFLGLSEFCLGCGNKTDQILLHRFEELDTTKEKDILDRRGNVRKVPIKIRNYSEFVRCTDCKYCSIRKISYDVSSKLLLDIGYFVPKRIDRLAIFKKDKKHNLNIPSKIYDLYLEVIETYNSSLFFSCGSCIRSLLEQICIQKGINENIFNNELNNYALKKGIEVLLIPEDKKLSIKRSINLKSMIDILAEDVKAGGHLTDEQMNVFHELREIYNESIHESNSPSLESLNASISIIERLVQIIFLEPIEKANFGNSITRFRESRR